jgi:hypothetical protein
VWIDREMRPLALLGATSFANAKGIDSVGADSTLALNSIIVIAVIIQIIAIIIFPVVVVVVVITITIIIMSINTRAVCTADATLLVSRRDCWVTRVIQAVRVVQRG